MSLVTPTPACTGEIDRERRPRCSIVDREAGAAWRRDPCRSPSLSRSGVPPAAVHHDGLMAAGRILAAGIDMSRARVSGSGDSARHPGRYGRRQGAALLSGSFRVAQSGRSWRSLSARSTDSALLACARVGGDRHRDLEGRTAQRCRRGRRPITRIRLTWSSKPPAARAPGARPNGRSCPLDRQRAAPARPCSRSASGRRGPAALATS